MDDCIRSNSKAISLTVGFIFSNIACNSGTSNVATLRNAASSKEWPTASCSIKNRMSFKSSGSFRIIFVRTKSTTDGRNNSKYL